MHDVACVRLPANMVYVKDLQTGQVGKGPDDEYLLRTYSHLVDLANPVKTWSTPFPPFRVEVLPPGTKITLTLGKDNC